MFSEEDLKTVNQYGIELSAIDLQISQFKKGFPPLPIIKNVKEGDGIHKIRAAEQDQLIEIYEDACNRLDVQKFVPASGAASRMFKSLYAFIGDSNASLKNHPDVAEFMENIKGFAFYDDLKNILKENGLELSTLLADEDYKTILNYVLEDNGLNYGFLPKGLLKFHQYPDFSRTAAEEHLVEAAQYAVSKGKQVYLHFTVSEQHLQLFEKHLNEVKGKYEALYGVSYKINYSVQDPATNTIAVDFDNKPFRDESGDLLFRPAGHGALLSNLNKLESDIVLVKNIDNVVPDRLKEDTVLYKKLLGGMLVKYQEKSFEFLKMLNSDNPTHSLVEEIVAFLDNEVFFKVPEEFTLQDTSEKISYLKSVLNRPIRICGMVVNTGATGGGPFWVQNEDGSASLQIVETAQMDMDDPDVKELLADANYFNPVDLVCGLKNYKGEYFNLMEYRDDNTGIITEKSMGGKNLKALELPGLWNGSMANWLTVFMEVPEITFNPVKSVNDLLGERHH